MSERQKGRQTERLFSLVIKAKVLQNVNRMSKRQTGRAPGRQTDQQTKRENYSQFLTSRICTASPIFISRSCPASHTSRTAQTCLASLIFTSWSCLASQKTDWPELPSFFVDHCHPPLSDTDKFIVALLLWRVIIAVGTWQEQIQTYN